MSLVRVMLLTEIKFTVYGEPVAQGRPKFTTINGHAKAYDPAKSRGYKEYVRTEALKVKPPKPLEGPIALKIVAYRNIPKYFSKKKTELAKQGEIKPITKPNTSGRKELWRVIIILAGQAGLSMCSQDMRNGFINGMGKSLCRPLS